MAESEPAMNTNNTEPQAGPRPGEPAWQVAGCLALLLVALHVVAGPKVRLSEWRLETPTANTNFLEALAWYSGRLDIPERVHDSALYQGRVYSVNPPLFSFVSYAATVMGANFPGLTVERHLRNFRWKNPADIAHYREGLLKAGVPSTKLTLVGPSFQLKSSG